MSRFQITPSTELMENYRQATVMAPERQLQALQDRAGHLLLLSVGSDDTGAPLNLTAEVPGERHGWRSINLTEALGRPCTHVAAAQRADGTIRLAVALGGGHGSAGDSLFLAELPAVSSADLVAPVWTEVPYDDPGTPRPRLEIAGVFASEAASGGFVLVDVVRTPGSATKQIVRYYVDPAAAGGDWKLHDVPVDIESGDYASVVGRRAGAGVDGVYVSGQIDGKPQIVYTPLFNEIRPDRHPLSAYLKLTPAGDVVADAIAACRLPDDSTDLYAAARGVLYRFASGEQGNGAVAVAVLTSPVLSAVTELVASQDPSTGAVTVWGRNRDDAIFATTLATDPISGTQRWSLPLPLLTGVQQVSPLLGRADGANTIVAHTAGDGLSIGVRSPGTGIWSWRRVTLPPPSTTTPAQKVNSYTTRVEVRDDRNQPAGRVTLAITASNRTSVYINHLYYVVGPTAIHVPTDATGSLTIVEAVPRMTGARFTFAVADDTATPATAVNPMDKAFKRAASLNTVDGLRSAKITSYVGGVPAPPRDLLKPGLSKATLEQVAQLNTRCAAIYADPAKPPDHVLLAAMAATADPFVVPADAPVVGAGDLFQHLEADRTARLLLASQTGDGLAAGETFWQMLVRWFEGLWEFVVKIGEAIYRCVLKVVEDVVSAIRWVFDAIVTAIEDLIEFLRFLFEWDDLKRTKDVIKNLTVSFFHHQCDQIALARQAFDDSMDTLIREIDAWAGIDELMAPGGAGAGPISGQATADGPSAPGALLGHHLQGNAGQAGHDGEITPPATPPSVMAVLEEALEKAGKALGETYEELRALVHKAPQMTMGQVLKDLVGILAGAVLKETRVVVDALLELLELVVRAALDVLDTPVHIPVLSDILNAVGVPDFSMLDAMCWVAAVPVTIGYKIAMALAGRHETLFPDTDETRFLVETTDFTAILAAFAPVRVSGAPAALDTAGVGITMSPNAAWWVFFGLHGGAGICAGTSAYFDFEESMLPYDTVPMWLSGASASSAFVGGVARAVANVLVPRYPLTDDAIRVASGFASGWFVLNKIYWAAKGIEQDFEEDPTDYRARGAAVDAVIVIPALVITCLHFAALAKHAEDPVRSAAIIDETSFLATYVARVLYTIVVSGALDENEEAKLIVAAIMSGSQVVHGILQLGEVAVYGFSE